MPAGTGTSRTTKKVRAALKRLETSPYKRTSDPFQNLKDLEVVSGSKREQNARVGVPKTKGQKVIADRLRKAERDLGKGSAALKKKRADRAKSPPSRKSGRK